MAKEDLYLPLVDGGQLVAEASSKRMVPGFNSVRLTLGASSRRINPPQTPILIPQDCKRRPAGPIRMLDSFLMV